MFAYGLPAGLMDEGEDIMDAALWNWPRKPAWCRTVTPWALTS